MKNKSHIAKQWTSGLLLAALPFLSMNIAHGLDFDNIPTAGQAVLEDRYPSREVAFDQGVTGLPDIVYAIMPGFQPLKLDLYLPPESGDADARYPVVLVIHGGGWTSGHSRHSGAFADWPGTLAALAADGYVVASINYRLNGEAPFPAAIQDVKSSILFLRANAEQYRIDPARMVTWGGSAGGQLAALAAVSCGVDALASDADIPGLDNAVQVSDCVQGAVVWYGVFDFTSLVSEQAAAQSPVAAYLDCAEVCPEENVILASPIALLDADDPSFLLVHGTEDSVVPSWQSENFQAKAEDLGVSSELILIPGVNHSFVGETEAATREASLSALRASVEFIQDLIGK